MQVAHIYRASPELEPNQVLYAATDAWLSRELFVTLSNLPYDPLA